MPKNRKPKKPTGYDYAVWCANGAGYKPDKKYTASTPGEAIRLAVVSFPKRELVVTLGWYEDPNQNKNFILETN